MAETREKHSPQVMSPKTLRPKELATVSRIEDFPGDQHQICDAQKEFGERDHRVPITEEVKEFGEFGNPASIDSKRSETSYFQSHTHFNDSAEKHRRF